ncbi:hypothetical protein NMY22_g4683 [Coprinellus aureogranulatus]|nr:hypothetical protein NMY22_g4683 [Coprinellus aureogranulatus]
MSYSEAPFKPARRDSRMPRLFKASNHPLLKNVPSDLVGQVYVGLMATDAKSMNNTKAFEKQMKCPSGGVQNWLARGLVQLRPGDYLFLRDPLVSKKPKDDVLAVMVTGPQHHDKAERAQFDKATLNMLGPRTKRSASSTAFEDTHCVRKIRSKRCYSLGTAVQMHRRIVAPSASLDQRHTNIARYQTMVKDLIDSTASMMVNVQDALPAECKKAFAANSELTGQPSIGKDEIYGTGSVQLNISAAGLFPGDTRLGNQLGDFGCEHFDKNDSPDHLTTMFANPDVPKEYKSGAFHILHLGVFVVLDKYVGVTFSGRRLHVGTAPTPPPGCPAVPYAYRFNVVWYPKDASVDGQSRFTLASLPGKKSAPSCPEKPKKPRKPRKEKPRKVGKGKGNGDKSVGKIKSKNADGPFPLYITPEMINMANEGFVPFTTNEATFARSGHIIMDREAHVNFVARALSQLETYVWRQLPSSYEIEIDRSKSRPDVTFRSEGRGGGRVRLKPWPSGPNVNTVSSARKQNLSVWAAYQRKVRRFLPHLASGRTASAKTVGPTGGRGDGSPKETSEAEDDDSDWQDDSEDEGFQLEVPDGGTQGPVHAQMPVSGVSLSASNGGESVQNFGHQISQRDGYNGEVGGGRDSDDDAEDGSGPMEGGNNPGDARYASGPENLASKTVQQEVAVPPTVPFNLADEHDETSDEEEVEALCQADIMPSDDRYLRHFRPPPTAIVHPAAQSVITSCPPPATLTAETTNSKSSGV